MTTVGKCLEKSMGSKTHINHLTGPNSTQPSFSELILRTVILPPRGQTMKLRRVFLCSPSLSCLLLLKRVNSKLEIHYQKLIHCFLCTQSSIHRFPAKVLLPFSRHLPFGGHLLGCGHFWYDWQAPSLRVRRSQWHITELLGVVKLYPSTLGMQAPSKSLEIKNEEEGVRGEEMLSCNLMEKSAP